jgi:hypothetical protein
MKLPGAEAAIELERDGKVARIRSCWIILKAELEPRFVTCFVL